MKIYKKKGIKLIKGDVLKLDLMRLIPDQSIDLILTDLPYGTTACKWDTILPFDFIWRVFNRVIKPNRAVILTASQPFTTTLISSNIKNFKYCWVWKKEQGSGHLNCKKQPLRICEDIVVFYKKQCLYKPQMEGEDLRVIRRSGQVSKTDNYNKFIELKESKYKGRYPINLLNFNRNINIGHPTQKPVELMEYLIKTYTNKNEKVLDLTAGSFTTAVACVRTKRKFIGFEKKKKYFNIGIDRVKQEFKNR